MITSKNSSTPGEGQKFLSFFVLSSVGVAALGYLISYLYLLELDNRRMEADWIFLNEILDDVYLASLDMTDMLRDYMVTGEEKYKDNYYRIRQLIAGEAPWPENYKKYWLLLSADPQYTPSLKGKLNYLELTNLDVLKKEEIDAVRTIQGAYKDRLTLEDYIIQLFEKSPEGKEVALDILFSEEYNRLKGENTELTDASYRRIKAQRKRLIGDNERATINALSTAGVIIIVLLVFFLRGVWRLTRGIWSQGGSILDP